MLGPAYGQLSGVSFGAWNPVDLSIPSWYGPYTLDEIGKSPNTNIGAGTWLYDTSSGANEDWVAGPLQGGLHEVIIHNTVFNGDKFDVVFTTTLGTFLAQPDELYTETYIDEGIVGEVTGVSSIPTEGVVARAVGPFSPVNRADLTSMCSQRWLSHSS